MTVREIVSGTTDSGRRAKCAAPIVERRLNVTFGRNNRFTHDDVAGAEFKALGRIEKRGKHGRSSNWQRRWFWMMVLWIDSRKLVTRQ